MDAELQRAIATIRRAGERGRQALQAAKLIPSPPQFSDGSQWILMEQSVEKLFNGASRAGAILCVSQVWRLASDADVGPSRT